MDIVDLPLERLIPYARNPRKNATAVATVAASLKEFGWRRPARTYPGIAAAMPAQWNVA